MVTINGTYRPLSDAGNEVIVFELRERLRFDRVFSQMWLDDMLREIRERTRLEEKTLEGVGIFP